MINNQKQPKKMKIEPRPELKEAFSKLSHAELVDNLSINFTRHLLAVFLLEKMVDVSLRLQKAHACGDVNGFTDLVNELGVAVEMVTDEMDLNDLLPEGVTMPEPE
ncbi:MAG: hypothetical protein HGB17_15305 [Syntrophobacteraceae bacterium]|nr:hypothetical protein [Syntrophobacteraceae bacterium]